MKRLPSTLAALCGLVYTFSTAQAALIGYWTFDTDTPSATVGATGTVLDLSGKGYDGTLNVVGVAPSTRYSTDVPAELAGIAGGKSLTLLGGNHYVQVGTTTSGANNTDFNFTGGPFTISYWFKAWPQTLDFPVIAKNGTATGGWSSKRSSVAANTTNLMFTTPGLSNVDFEPPDTVGINASLTTGTPTPVPTGPGRWTHMTLTYDNTLKTVYVNGVQIRSVVPTANGKITATTDPVVFGARSVAGVIGGYSNVQLDDVAIFNHALTAAEAMSLARGADPRTVPAVGRQPLLTRSYPWGVGEPLGTPGNFGVRALRDTTGPSTTGGTTINNLGDLSYLLRNKSAVTRLASVPFVDGSYGKVSFRDPDNSGATGIFAGPTAAIAVPAIPPNTTSYYYTVPWNIAGNEDYALLTATGCIRIPAGVAAADNKWTFFHGGDDGTQLVIYGQNWLSRSNTNSLISGEVSVHGAQGGNSAVFSTVVLPPGDYNVRFDYYERTGGSWVELWAAPGTLTAITASTPPTPRTDNWRLVGDTAAGGLALVDHLPLVELTSDTNAIVGTPPASINLTYDQRFCDSPSITKTDNTGTSTLQALTLGHGVINIAPAPTVTTTYTLAGTHAGQTVTRTVTVYANQAPAITAFTVADNTLAPGFGSTFTVGTVGGSSWSIDNGIGAVSCTTANGINSGTKTFTIPNGTAAGVYTYTLTATNSVGSSTATLTITVAPPPVISLFNAMPSSTGGEQGSLYTIQYNITDADTAVISPRLGSLAPSAVRTFIGEICDYPSQTTTYTVVATNIYGTSTATSTANIYPIIGMTAAGWTVTLYKAATAGTVSSLAGVDGIIAGTVARGNVTVNAVSTPTPITKTNVNQINFSNSVAPAFSGVFPNDTWPAEFGSSGLVDAVVKCTGTLIVNVEDDYTLSMNNDDGGRLRVDLNNDGDFLDAGEDVILDDSGHAPTTFSNDRHLTVGPHNIEYVYFQATGGQAGECFFTDSSGTNRLLEPGSQPPAIVTTDLIISEFQASNSGTLNDYDGQTSDWIELYNGTAASIPLADCALSDDDALAGKWNFPAATPALGAGKYLVVFASGKNTVFPNGEIHTNFKLNSNFIPPAQGYVGLARNVGGTFTTLSSYHYGDQKKDRSYGVSGVNQVVGVMAVASPSGRNNASYLGFVGDTNFSNHRGNNYSTAFNLTITTPDAASTIRYTLDGSEPTVYKGTIYTGPIPISVTTVIRCAAFHKGYAPSNIDTETYIFPVDVVTQNRAQAIAHGWPDEPNGSASATLNSQVFDYGMDPQIYTGNEAAIQAALKAIPSLSLVVDPSSLFDKTSGIFVNPSQRGKAWERLASLELINDVYADPTLATKAQALDGNGQFQIACGTRIRGGASRSPNNPKREWHLYFRPQMDGSLNYPIFGADGTNKFDQFDIKTANNYAWSYAPTNQQLTYTPVGGVSTIKRVNMNTMMRDVFSRDTLRDMGQPTGRGRYYHLYINGVYWGLNEIEERTEASYGEQYLGGSKGDYDCIKSSGNANSYNTEATDGTMLQGTTLAPGSAWARLWFRCRELRAKTTDADRDAAALDLMGLKPDGTPWNDAVNHPILLDTNDLTDYLLTSFYCGSYDAPMSTFVSTGSNNWFGLRDRNGNRGFTFYAHDFEHGFGTDWVSGSAATNITYTRGSSTGALAINAGLAVVGWQLHTADSRSLDRTGPWGGGDGVTGAADTTANTTLKQERNHKGQLMYELSAQYLKSNPHLLHEDLCFSREYRRRFADRAYYNLGRPGGALTQPEVFKRLDARANIVSSAIIGESARWGDAKGQALADYQVSSWTNGKNFLYDWVSRGSNQAYSVFLSEPANAARMAPGGGYYNVSTKALTTNVAVLTIGNHGFVIGNTIKVNIGDAVFDGTQIVTAVATTTVSFAKTNANVTSVAATGTVWATAASSGFTSITNKGLTSNVATLTLPNHTFVTGQTVLISTGDAVFDGLRVLTSVVPNQISFAKTNVDVAATAVIGYAWPQVALGRSGEIIRQLKGYKDKQNGLGVTLDANVPTSANDAALLSLPLYPLVDAPAFDLAAGIYGLNTPLTISNPNVASSAPLGTIYYTIDGTDPRSVSTALPVGINGGNVGSTVISLTQTGPVKARIYNSANLTWSGLTEVSYIIGVPATHANLIITEVNYNPGPSIGPSGVPNPGTALDPQLYEFIELLNISSTNTLQLTGVNFSLGITYAFPAGVTLAPQARLVIVRDIPSFKSRYPNVPDTQIYGPYTGALNNGGERVTLLDAVSANIQSIHYNKSSEIWPRDPMGNGPTLIMLNPDAPLASALDAAPASFTSHLANLGNPGGPDFGYTAYRLAYAASTNGLGDADQDGISDLIEYVLGTLPGTPDAASKLPTAALANIVIGGNPAELYQTISYTRAPNTADVTVAAQTSHDLGGADPWTSNAVLVSTTINGDGSTTYVFRAPQPYAAENRVYLRLLVTLPAL